MQDRVLAELERSKINTLVGLQYNFKTIHELEDVYKQSPEHMIPESSNGNSSSFHWMGWMFTDSMNLCSYDSAIFQASNAL